MLNVNFVYFTGYFFGTLLASLRFHPIYRWSFLCSLHWISLPACSKSDLMPWHVSAAPPFYEQMSKLLCTEYRLSMIWPFPITSRHSQQYLCHLALIAKFPLSVNIWLGHHSCKLSGYQLPFLHCLVELVTLNPCAKIEYAYDFKSQCSKNILRCNFYFTFPKSHSRLHAAYSAGNVSMLR